MDTENTQPSSTGQPSCNPNNTNSIDERRKLEYETLNNQINSRSSNLWTIASIFIPVSWLVFTYCVLNLDKIDIIGVSLLAVASLSSVLFICLYNKYVNYMNSSSHYGLYELEKHLEICVHRFQRNFINTKTRTIVRKIIYILSLVSFLAWSLLGLEFFSYSYTFKVIVDILLYCLGTGSLLPGNLLFLYSLYPYWYWYNHFYSWSIYSLITLLYFCFMIGGIILMGVFIYQKEEAKEIPKEVTCNKDCKIVKKTGRCIYGLQIKVAAKTKAKAKAKT